MEIVDIGLRGEAVEVSDDLTVDLGGLTITHDPEKGRGTFIVGDPERPVLAFEAALEGERLFQYCDALRGVLPSLSFDALVKAELRNVLDGLGVDGSKLFETR
ncbi:hypothetical protein MRY87_08400 [bacterium]|nr:hypothetical protein [bacterium]